MQDEGSRDSAFRYDSCEVGIRTNQSLLEDLKVLSTEEQGRKVRTVRTTLGFLRRQSCVRMKMSSSTVCISKFMLELSTLYVAEQVVVVYEKLGC